MKLDKNQYFFMKLVVNVKRKIDTYLEGYGVKKVMLKGKEPAEIEVKDNGNKNVLSGGREHGIQSSDGKFSLGEEKA